MNMKIKYKYGVGAAMVLLMATACTDTWEQHYQQELAGETSLWEAISEQGNLSNFAKVIDACDYDLVLNGIEMASGSIRITDPELQKRMEKERLSF